MTDHDARDPIVGQLWTHIRTFMTTENIRNYPAAARAIDAGADTHDVQTAMAAAAYEAVFGTLYDLAADPEEFEALAASGIVNGLHESLLSADPTGLDGADLFR